jgi:hypothetical protein
MFGIHRVITNIDYLFVSMGKNIYKKKLLGSIINKVHKFCIATQVNEPLICSFGLSSPSCFDQVNTTSLVLPNYFKPLIWALHPLHLTNSYYKSLIHYIIINF